MPRTLSVAGNSLLGKSVVVFAGVLLSAPAGAQQSPSAIAGVVRDTSGGVLPGVTVEAASPALIDKVRTAVTDSGSEVARFPDKPGISNLIEVLAVVRGVSPEVVESEFDGHGYGRVKQPLH